MIERITRKQVSQEARGKVFVLEDATLPFPMRRTYVISGVSDPTVSRGGHTHHKTDQAMFVIQGALTLLTDDGTHEEIIRLTDKDDGVRLPPLLWHSMKEFTPDCVVLVAANLPYDATDYIHSYEDFKKYAGTI